MPAAKPSQTKPKRVSRSLLLVVALALIALAATTYYLTRPTTPQAEAPDTTTPFTARHIYFETADAHADIASALAQAAREHKRVLLDFGGDWCGDCQVLDIYFHQPPNAALLASNFVLVHVWIGHMDGNLDIPARYGVPLAKGVPALAVLAPSGETLYAQSTGEFENMRNMDPADVTQFLNTWKG